MSDTIRLVVVLARVAERYCLVAIYLDQGAVAAALMVLHFELLKLIHSLLEGVELELLEGVAAELMK